MFNKIVLILGLLLIGCTYETYETSEFIEDEMGKSQNNVSGWSQSGTLTPGVSDRGVPLQVQFEEAGDYTAQFFISNPNTDPDDNVIIRPRAEIVWSVQGNDVRRLVDCINGMTVQGVGQAVKIKIYDDSNIPAGPLSPEPQDYIASVQVAKGSRGSVQQPPYYTSDISGLADGATETVQVPINAGAISAMVTVAPQTDGDVIPAYGVIVRQTSNSNIIGLLKKYDPRQSDWVPLAAGANYIQITNQSGFNIFYQVTFGIDG